MSCLLRIPMAVLIAFSLARFAVFGYEALANDDDHSKLFHRCLLPVRIDSSMSRATVAIILNDYVPLTSYLSISRSSIGRESHDKQSGFLNHIVSETRSKIAFTIAQFWSLAGTRRRYFNILFVDGYQAFR